jgi:hypothetical protein
MTDVRTYKSFAKSQWIPSAPTNAASCRVGGKAARLIQA